MSVNVKFDAVSFGEAERRLAAAPTEGERPLVLIAFAGAKLALGGETRTILRDAEPQIARAAAAAKFTGKRGSALDLYAPAGLPSVGRLILVGVGAAGDGENADKSAERFDDYLGLGGQTAAKLGQGASALVLFDLPEAPADAAAAGQFALGATLRSYKFDLYRTKKKKDESERDGVSDIALAVAAPEAAQTSVAAALDLADGVIIARDLVNEPANVLYPEEFARRAAKLADLGVEVEILDVPALQALGFRALLGVGQGSAHASRVVVLRWNGGAKDAQPIAFVGKGVCFDTGGISIKPAASMEDMKGDMAGAAAVTGLMHALAARKAKANVIGVLGLVENMPSGEAQRPGDIVASLSGQTIEIINTDAEGRLVLADALWHVKDKYKPAFIIDLATLTGAILVALGQEHAGLFSNNDELAGRILEAGKATGEKLWRLPMGPAYDKLIESKFADMKNTGGRHAGSITAAQFLERFVDKTPWAHLDIAGTGMGSPASDTNQSWASGWGVRLLDRLVKDYYES
ncbi:leucyl aminopeptidase [Methylosinus trichosporium]|uniref:Probable cytosol aminopeptidase n=1 Tax=Methylosinus trichosporium (strain ATCC 35070 / NCIMB 11131 / UNIQEM 75 / OB3b) TaxID=595536 RepID=A0A2D2CXA5_METT3|nr:MULTISPECIES: leucyl aminopeptidase [Methylosinus]ATQ67333.1 leucyl aminopeptidase [Methylosinus trichosporium OB3b]OBS50686.1 leucyl aminopeptidase [Methylosinus sp. 3S-1]